ncbi:uncharacterized protein LOC131952954 [Physella acuta]|uniref:uncharacterized protein LOC131952954 n=1 Tax=Physella acuta TaxID=109671 RepID=UPI0027DB38AD|nr:uncharacterized protein LOC131952954 [Physella acuta]
MAFKCGTFWKELQRLNHTVDKLTLGQVKIENVNLHIDDTSDDTKQAFYIQVTPKDGHYKGALIKFQVEAPVSYPAQAPIVKCLNSIYHPNIDLGEQNIVCVSLLDKDWQPGVGLDGCVMAVLFLFYHPNFLDALNVAFDGQEMNESEFHKNVRASLRGEEVEGFIFDRLLPEDYTDDISSEPSIKKDIFHDETRNKKRSDAGDINFIIKNEKNNQNLVNQHYRVSNMKKNETLT